MFGRSKSTCIYNCPFLFLIGNNQGTENACFARIMYLANAKAINLCDGDKIIALENGIYEYPEYNKFYDICCMMVYDHMAKK